MVAQHPTSYSIRLPPLVRYLPVKMSAEDACLTFEAIEADSPASSDVSDPIIKDFVEVLALAQRKANLNTKYTYEILSLLRNWFFLGL